MARCFHKQRFFSITFLLFFSTLSLAQVSDNPAMPGFDHDGSDAEAMAIADEVMQALGGRENWDNTRYVTWKFFGRRLHVWDKWTGNIRFEGNDMLALMNLNTREGRAWKNGTEITHPDSLEKALYSAESAWINDSYWMFMPYKLKDSGVTLKYVGDGEMEDGRAADILELTFEGVGRTPNNRYHVFVSKENRLVEQWNFFTNADDAEPRFKTPWANWQRYGAILLSDDRGRGKHSDIAVFETLPASVFTDPAPVDMMALAQAAANK